MEASSITVDQADEDEALKSLIDAFGSEFSLQDIASAFCKAARNSNLAGQILCGTQTSSSAHDLHISNGFLTNTTSSRASDGKGFSKSQHPNDSSFSTSKRIPFQVGNIPRVPGKSYVWRVAGSRGTANGTKPLKIDANKSSIPVSSSEESPLGMDTNSSSSEDSSLVRDVDLNDDIEGCNKSQHADDNSSNVSQVKRNPVPLGPISSVPGKNCVWRVARPNGSGNVMKPLEMDAKESSVIASSSEESLLISDANSTYSEDSSLVRDANSYDYVEGSSKSQHRNDSISNAYRVRRNPVSAGTVSSILGKSYVWRIAQSNGTKPLKVDIKESPFLVSSSESLLVNDVDSHSSETLTLMRDNKLNDDVEDFLFEMLGRGFQLERTAIQEVLGRCGYDMKKSLESLLDLTAATLDNRYNLQEDSNLDTESEALSSQSQVHKRKKSERNGILSRQPNGRYEQPREVLTTLFHAPERQDSTVSASLSKTARRSMPAGSVVSEPLEDISEEHKANYTIPRLVKMDDEADEGPYQILRKAVKEHRDTMKEYYRAAFEAFASGNHARASLLMEKGRDFFKKAREADEESAFKIFETSGGDDKTQDGMSLDLQDHDAKEAIRLVKCHLRSLSGISSIEKLKIMIGKGGRDVEKRKRVVIKLLEKEAIKWIEDENLGTISILHLDEINPKSLSFANK